MQESPLAPIKIVGSRGAGKTTLLNCAAEMAEARNIQVVRLSHMKDLPIAQAYRHLFDEMLRHDEGELVFTEDPNRSLDLSFISNDAIYELFFIYRSILRAIVARKPVLFLLDDAMHCDNTMLELIMRESNLMLNSQLPLSIMMTGTPVLTQLLFRLDNQFHQRTEDININELSDAAVREALAKPLKQRKIKIIDNALDLLASRTDNHPYFVQAAGRAVWDVLERTSGSKVDLTVVKKAEPAMNKTRKTIYHKVYEDLQDLGLANYANQAIAIVEEADQPLTPAQVIKRLAASNQDMDEQNAKEIFDLLRDKDLIWLAGKRRVYPSIPSFFTYFKQEYATDQQ